jgi:hypothetical protein
MQRINYNPRMTRRLIEQGMFRSNDLAVMDAGARGGAGSIWNFFARQEGVRAMSLGHQPKTARAS